MRVSKLLGLLVGLLVAGAVVGSLLALVSGPLQDRAAAGVTLAVVVVAVAGLAVVGAKNREWLANTYW